MKTIVIKPAAEGIGLPGCQHIYAPKGQAGEYAPLAANPYDGCGHLCRYCYVPNVRHITRQYFDADARPREDFLRLVEKDARKYKAAGITEQVMLSFTTDPYNPKNTSLTRPTLEKLQEYGLGICVLTKGGARSLVDIDLFRPERDAYACTLTTLDDNFSRKWEPAAALPDERIGALREAHYRDIFTWVSLEPTLDIEASLAIVRATHTFVDLFKIGRANYLGPLTSGPDWRDYTLRMIELCHQLGARHYIKKDLQQYLPAGYHNPMRVQQHH